MIIQPTVSEKEVIIHAEFSDTIREYRRLHRNNDEVDWEGEIERALRDVINGCVDKLYGKDQATLLAVYVAEMRCNVGNTQATTNAVTITRRIYVRGRLSRLWLDAKPLHTVEEYKSILMELKAQCGIFSFT